MLAEGPQSRGATRLGGKRVFVIEDVREACQDLRKRGYTCDRITHNELMTSVGTEYLGSIINGEYFMVWISTPADWYVRTPGKRMSTHWQRIQNILIKASKLKSKIIMFGPPGYVWKISAINDTIEDLKLSVVRMRLCHFGIKFNLQDRTPSGTYMQIATSFPINSRAWPCNCKLDINKHVLDWYGKTIRHAEWRNQTRTLLIGVLHDRLLGRGKHGDVPVHGSVPSYLLTYTRTDKNIRNFVTTKPDGPKWSQVIRRITYDLDSQTIIQDITVAEQPTGYDWHAPLPDGVTNIATRLLWQEDDPVLLGDEPYQSPKDNRFVILDDCPSPLPTLALDTGTPSFSTMGTQTGDDTTALPTESRIKQKERLKAEKEAGIKPRRIKKHVEDGDDDCGESLAGLGADIMTSWSTDAPSEPLSSDDEDLFTTFHRPISDDHADIFSIVATLCYGRNNSVDMIELCGGMGGISQLAFSRGLSSGGNLDKTTNVDLGDPTIQRAVDHYLDTCYVRVAILQPSCRTTGPPSYFNAQANYNTWKAHHKEDLPHIMFCGWVAMKQDDLGRWYLREQPTGTWVDEIQPWKELAQRNHIVSIGIDQCATGLRDDFGDYIKKPTDITSNDETILKPFATFRCNGSHVHAQPCNKQLTAAQHYTKRLQSAFVEAVYLAKTLDKLRGDTPDKVAQAFPNTVEAVTDPPQPEELRARVRRLKARPLVATCPACVDNIRANSPSHNRDPLQCKYVEVIPVYWKCEYCQRDYTRRPGHTLVSKECRFAKHYQLPDDHDPTGRTVPEWWNPPPRPGEGQSSSATGRHGAHPRPPRPRAPGSADPLSGASSHDILRDEPQHGDVPTSRGDAPTPATPSMATARRGRQQPIPPPPDPFPDAEDAADNPQRTIRNPRTNTGSGATRLPDWTRFNIQVSLQNLRSYEPHVVKKELRKLHLRWFHAKEPKMRMLLEKVGLDSVRLNMIKEVCDTCRECRAWQRPGNSTLPSVSLPGKFCEEGELDLMFYKRHIIFHILDRCIRLAAGQEIPDKERDTLIDAYYYCWLAHHYPFQTLYSDGEGGLNNDAAKKAFANKGTVLKIRAPGQHATSIESRNGILRATLHIMEEELKRHNIPVVFKRLLAEAMFATNAFTFYNGMSPYNALTGRQPQCLPDLETPDFPKGPEMSGHEREQHIRQVSLEAITQATAVAKTNRALRAKTAPDGARLYSPGDLVDYHRPTATKDDHGGWNGPYPVIRNEPERGQLVVKAGSREIIVQYPDARHTLYVEALLTREMGMDNTAMRTVLSFIAGLGAGKPALTFGYLPDGKGSLRTTDASKLNPRVHMALQFLVRNYFRVDHVVAVRLAKSVHKLAPIKYATGCTMIHYDNDVHPAFHYYECNNTGLDVPQITGSNHSRIIQCLTSSKAGGGFHEDLSKFPDLADPPPDDRPPGDRPPAETPMASEHDGRLSTIQEESEEHDIELLIMEDWYEELRVKLEPVPLVDDVFRVPTMMVPDQCVMVSSADPDDLPLGDEPDQEVFYAMPLCSTEPDDEYQLDTDEHGEYVELCFTSDMAPTVLSLSQLDQLTQDSIATMRVYVSAAAKRAVVVKEDDLLTKADIQANPKKVAEALYSELKIWLDNRCFEMYDISKATNIMTSRYVYKWKLVKVGTEQVRTIRLRLVLRGFMDVGGFDVETFSGTARRQSQRLLASEAACHPEWILASMDIDKAFLKGLTYEELAQATGEATRQVCFTLPPGSAQVLRTLPGFSSYDESRHCLRCLKPGTGTKDAPRAFSLKLRTTTRAIGLSPTSFDPEFEFGPDLLTAKHVDDINITGLERNVDNYVKRVESVFGTCKVHKHTYTNCAVRYTKNEQGDVIMDQDEYIKQLRPITHPELTGAAADAKATKIITDMFVSLRGALAYALITQIWLMVYVVSLQRIQEPTNLQVRRLNAITRKLISSPKKITFPCMKPTGEVDIHSDSGYRKLTGDEDDETKGYGIRGANMLRRGSSPSGKAVVHLCEGICKSHRLQVRSSYAAEALAAAHNLDECYPTLITLHELQAGPLSSEALRNLREAGGLCIKVSLTIDAESVYKSLSSKDLKIPTERTLLGHISWIRELMDIGIVHNVQWCDTRDMSADGHTKGCIDRDGLLEVMSGTQSFKYDVKQFVPFRGPADKTNPSKKVRF